MAALTHQESGGSGLLELTGDPHDIVSVVSDEYGTFEVSTIDIESEFDGLHGRKPPPTLCERLCSTCSEELLFVWLLLSAPFQFMTYRTLLFHSANFFFSVAAVLCILALYTVKLPAYLCESWLSNFRRLEMWWLRRLLRVDCKLFNFISPRGERVRVYSASIHMQQEEGLYGVYAQLYFGGVKLLCAGVPGAIAALMFLWSLQNVVQLTMELAAGSSLETSSISGSADHELDAMTVVGVVAIYACVLLLHVFAFISRQFTIFFCSQYLLYAGGA